MDVVEKPGGQIRLEEKLCGCLEGAWDKLLTLFWELMFFLTLAGTLRGP